jgi:hypothetical protein
VDVETGEIRPGAARAVPAEWTRPEGLTTALVDSETGKLLTEWCPTRSAREEVFLAGTEPTELCDVHAPGLFGAPLHGLPHSPPGAAPADTAAIPPDG